ncbi:hypothetical protein [Ilyobacter sp.]|uniref:hypothetical protein n=1 Tax=Ilyobacter sp. TaxID=3100343 RepID=UPI00356B5DD9
MENIARDNLINGAVIPALVQEVTVPAGTWKRGTVLGKYSGAYNLMGETNYDVSTVDCIIAEDITLAAEGKAQAFFTGQFSKGELTVKDGFDVDTLADPARKLNIFIK